LSGAYTREGIRRTRGSSSVNANAVRALLDSTDFTMHHPAASASGYRVHVHPKMVDGALYVDHTRRTIVVSRDTWATLTHAVEAQGALIDLAIAGAGGMRFLPMDTGPFAEAVRIEAVGMDFGKSEVDRVGNIEARADALLVAAGNHTGTDMLQTQLLMADYNRLIEDADALIARLTRVRSKVETAGETAFGV
jgi:hypothetical protein